MKPENFVMADIFTHTNGLAVHVNHTALNDNFNDGVTPFDAIDHAVANHDALKETLRLKEEENKQIADENKQLRAALGAMLLIVFESSGVSGYHMNGDIADWDEFEEVEAAKKLMEQIKCD